MQVMRNNATAKKYKNIMIAGFGTSVTRLFFDNLYDALSVEFLKANITSEKKFTGNDSVVVVPAINKLIESQAYDAVLIIAPHSGGFVTEKNIANPLARNELEQNFKFNVFDKSGLDNPIWELNLSVNIYFTQTKPYQILAEKIVENMKQNKLVQ